MSDCSCIDRRTFLKLGGLTLVISAVNPSFAKAVGDPRLDCLRRSSSVGGKTFVYVFQRFGADGLNIVVPREAGEHALYMSYRPTLGIPLASLAGMDVSPDFALNPVVRDTLYSLWTSGQVAVFPDVGYPEASRSHFDSQFFVDNGTPWDKTTPDGWLNRYMQLNALPGAPLRAIAFNDGLPFPLVGEAPALSFTNLADLSVAPNPTRDAKYLDIQRRVYEASGSGRPYDAELASVGVGLVDAINAIRASSLPAPTPSMPYPATTFGSRMSQLAQLLKTGDFEIEIAIVDLGGWDTHANQQSATDPLTGAFPNLVAELFGGIYSFSTDVGDAIMNNTLVLTTSEFGRTTRQNGNLGTDHGSAWASVAIGGPAGGLRSGVYHGAGGWRGLDTLRDDRDLNYSLDFRDIYTEILTRHLAGSVDSSLFPGWSYSPIGFL